MKIFLNHRVIFRTIKLFSLLHFALFSYKAIADCEYGTCNLKIYGTVVATSCDVDTTSSNQTVDLGNMSIGAFRSVGDNSPFRSFTIRLKDCSSSIQSGSIAFLGEANNINPSLLQLTNEPGMARGVAIQVLNGDSKEPISINSRVPIKNLSPGANELRYLLRYQSTEKNVVAGTANAVMYFDIAYE